MLTIKAHSTPNGIVHLLYDENIELLCSSISHARKLRHLLLNKMLVVSNNGKVLLNPSLRGEFNKLIVALKISKPIRKSVFDKEILSFDNNTHIDFKSLLIKKNDEHIEIQQFSDVKSLIKQLK